MIGCAKVKRNASRAFLTIVCGFTAQLFMATPSSAAVAGADAAAELGLVLDQRRSVIDTIGFSYVVTLEPAEAYKDTVPPQRSKVSVRHKGDRIRSYEYDKDEAHLSPREYAFDGKKSRMIHRPGPTENRGRLRMTVQKGLAPQLIGAITPCIFLTETVNLIPLASAIKEHGGSVTVDDDGKVALTWTWGTPGAITQQQYYFDSAQDYAVLGFKTTVDGNLSQTGEVTKHKMANVKGVTVPVPTEAVIKSHYYWPDGLKPLGTLINTQKVSVQSFEINSNYPDRTFTPQISLLTPANLVAGAIVLAILIGLAALAVNLRRNRRA